MPKNKLITAISTILFFLLSATLTFSAPVVVIPGEGAGYIYYSASSGAAAPAPVADETNIGMVAAFFVQPDADKWIVCDGRTIFKAQHPELVKVLTGSDAAASTDVPDLRGYFLRGWDSMGTNGAAGRDPGRTLKSAQNDDNKSHAHTGTAAGSGDLSTQWGGEHSHQVIGYAGITGASNPHHISSPTNGWTGSHTGFAGGHAHLIPSHAHALTINNSGGLETRPKNISVIYAIRAK